MEQKDDEPPPFWLQSTATLRQVNHHRRRQRHTSSLFLNTGVLVVVLLITAVVFLVIVIPSVLSLARQVFNPSVVKSSWSSLNIVLVLFAIVCGFLGRKDDDQTPVNTPKTRSEVENKAELQQSPRQWYEYNQDRMSSYNSFGNVDTIRRLRRSSSSYPDLRQESAWMVKENSHRWRFYDDTDVENHQFQRSETQNSRSTASFRNIEVDTYVSKTEDNVSPVSTSSSPSPSVVDEEEWKPPSPAPAPESGSNEVIDEDVEEEPVIKEVEEVNPMSDQPKIAVSPSYIAPPSPPTYILPPPSPTSYLWPPPSPSPPPPPPPPPPRRANPSMPSRNKTAQTFETIGHGRYVWNDNSTKRESRSKVQVQAQPPIPPPPPPAPQTQRAQPVSGHHLEDKHKAETSDRKRGGATKEFFTSFYHQSKRKRKQKRRSYENLEEFIEPPPRPSIYRSKSTPEFPPPSPPPPLPPPLPPPHSVFHNLFSKKGKTKKKVHSVSTSAPPPPPPPPPRTRPPPEAASTVQPTKVKTKFIPSAPRKPVKKVSFSSVDDHDHAGSGGESPLVRTPPPPPPPPPFKMKGWHFVTQGDYVKIESNNNSPRSGYSASEDESGSPSNTQNNSPTATPSLFCPSPDVNTKADDFIAKFRAKLNLEKLDSINLKQGLGPSRLGQS